MKHLILIIFIHVYALAFEPYQMVYKLKDVQNSSCYKEYNLKFSSTVDLETLKKLKSDDINEKPMLNKRELNLALASVKGEGFYTFDEIYCKVQEFDANVMIPEVVDWLRYGFISGDFCPTFPFINGYYNWESAYKYIIRQKIRHSGQVPDLLAK